MRSALASKKYAARLVLPLRILSPESCRCWLSTSSAEAVFRVGVGPKWVEAEALEETIDHGHQLGLQFEQLPVLEEVLENHRVWKEKVQQELSACKHPNRLLLHTESM